MKTFNNTKISKKYKSSALAIGNFDGVHKGHQKVFKQARQYAKKNRINFGVLTFSPLPIMFFNKSIKNIDWLLINKNLNFLKDTEWIL